VEAVSDPWTDEPLESLRERAQEQNKGTDLESVPEEADISPDIPPPESVTYVDYDNPFALIGESCGTTPFIHQLSSLAWVGVGGDIYVLECLGAGFIRVEPLTDPNGKHSRPLAP
jgi:ATP-dependent helicase IRC3